MDVFTMADFLDKSHTDRVKIKDASTGKVYIVRNNIKMKRLLRKHKKLNKRLKRNL